MKKLFLSWKVWLGLLVSAFFLWFAFKDMDFGAVEEAFLQANYRPLFLVAALLMLAQVFRSFRWQVILRPTKHVPFWTIFSFQMIGFMILNVLPLRIGEVVKAYLLSRKEKISTSLVLATVVVERIFDGFVVASLFFVSLLFVKFPVDLAEIDAGGLSLESALYKGAYLMMGGLGAIAVFLVFLRLKTNLCIRVIDKIIFFLPERYRARLLGMLEGFADGLSCIRSVGGLLGTLIYSILIWLALALSFYVGMFCFEWQGHPLADAAGYWGALFIQSVAGLAVAIPSSPGFVGVFQTAVVYGFRALGVEGGSVGGYSILQHAITYGVITGCGAFFAWKEGFSLAEVAERSEEEAEEFLEELDEVGEEIREEIEEGAKLPLE